MGYRYEFVALELEVGHQGYSMLGGIGLTLEGHQAIIRARAADGWRYCGWLPLWQRAEGYIEQVELVFERQEADA